MKSTPVVLRRREEALANGGRSFAGALESPCMTCATSPCCSHLPLRTMQLQTLLDVDYCRYLLNFEGIMLGVAKSGDWSVYYRRACRHLDPATAGCGVHGTRQQPHVCQHYNPFTCWYRDALSDDSDDFLPLDRGRFDALLAGLVFDEKRAISSFPSWDSLQETCAPIPLEPPPTSPPLSDPILDEWRAVALQSQPHPQHPAAGGSAAAPRRGTDPSLTDPCTGCSAPCCTTLTFPVADTRTMAIIDYLRFSLGFPGIELGLTDETWVLAVKTRCRHLDGDRCGIYGSAERPLQCAYYDAYHCTYVGSYGRPRPPGYLRVTYEELPWVVECLGFDEAGTLVAMPSVDELRLHVERRLREQSQAAGAEPQPPPYVPGLRAM